MRILDTGDLQMPFATPTTVGNAADTPEDGSRVTSRSVLRGWNRQSTKIIVIHVVHH